LPLQLEEVLKDKERELKLYQRFQDLKGFCQKSIFPAVDPPLEKHVETLTQLIERIIPDPKDRTEEMFSGEIFALLGTIYLHDVGFVKNYGWYGNAEIFNALDSSEKRMLVNYGIGKELDIPDTAMGIINCLTFSDVVKKIPLEWEITEGTRKAIIRNTRVIENIFNFAHLLSDMFYAGLADSGLRRFSRPTFALNNKDTDVEINSREGTIRIKYDAKSPYELHVIEKAKTYVEDAFNVFKSNVNGRLGFQYRELVWEITSDFDYYTDSLGLPRFSCDREHEGSVPFGRWEEASTVLDKLFDHGYALVVGEESAGKTMVLTAFIIPQIVSIAPNTFYCELWANPVNEIRDVICKKYKTFSYSGLDIVSICANLLKDGPCFFVIDACERAVNLHPREREKFERFVDFCFKRENIYLVVCGDNEDFFDWYTFFSSMKLSAVTEIKPIKGATVLERLGEGRIPCDPAEFYKPAECEMFLGELDLEGTAQGMLDQAENITEFRTIMAVLIDRNEKHLKRYSMDTIAFETSIGLNNVKGYLEIMKKGALVKETEFLGSPYYSLANRFLKEPLFELFKLQEFDEKRKIRNMIQNALINDTFLDADALSIIQRWKENMVFSKEGMGIILGSLIFQGEDFRPFFERARHSDRGIDIQPVLKLIYSEDAQKRSDAVRLLVEIQDKNMVNPLLLHLKKENVLEIKDLLIKGIGLTGKKKAVVAILNILKEIGDGQLRLRAIEFFHALFGKNAMNLLAEIKEKEEDPLILAKIEELLSTTET
jgi:hypothetical protein